LEPVELLMPPQQPPPQVERPLLEEQPLVLLEELVLAPPAAAPAQLRLLKKRQADFENTLDVRTEFSALDITDKDAALPTGLRHRAMPQIGVMAAQDGICMSPFGLSLFLIAGVAFMGVIVAGVTYAVRPAGKM
jgi:hypothetical protein